jgi:hypothetical protein
LTGEQKEAYQREYMKEYMRRKRLGLTSRSNTGLTKIYGDITKRIDKTIQIEANLDGAGGGSRTHKVVTPEDFKSSASAYSATPAR